jgi:hypothetical protein
MPWRIGEWGALALFSPWCYRWRWCGRGRGADPDEYLASLINAQALGLDDFGFEIFEEIVVEVELPLERPVSHTPAALKYGENLVEYCIEIHLDPPYQALASLTPHGDSGASQRKLQHSLRCIDPWIGNTACPYRATQGTHKKRLSNLLRVRRCRNRFQDQVSTRRGELEKRLELRHCFQYRRHQHEVVRVLQPAY